MSLLSIVVSGLALSSSFAAAVPQLSFGNAAGVVAGKCAGQSCEIANVAGTTGDLPSKKPEGGSAAGWVCVGKYNPEGKAAVEKGSGGKSGKGGKLGGLFGARSVDFDISQSLDIKEVDMSKRQLFGGRGGFSGSCKPNILIFAKGTTEIGALGSTVGPALSSALKGANWEVVGVNYTADMAGNNCVGLLGGMIAKDMVEGAAQKCPNSKIFTSGYSQGAMVARVAVAYANDAAKAKVAGVLVYGDPFNGSKIKGWNGPIKTFCRSTDAVCTGAFKIGASHLAYAASSDISVGVKWLNQIAGGR